MTRNYRYFMGDFETTVYAGQTNTEVWASACVELFTEDVKIFHSIGETFDYLLSLNDNIVIYYHNLKFDGTFWLSYLMLDTHFTEASVRLSDIADDFYFQPIKEMPNDSYTYSISDMGQWYRIIIKHGRHIIEIRDSLKLLPFSVKRIGESFKTKHKKLDMEYTGFRYAGCEITEDERKYIANDVLVVKEALEIMQEEGHKKLTIGSCCLSEYKKLMGHNAFKDYFPDLYSIPIDEKFGAPNAGEYVRKSYRGGWCYLVKGKEKQIYSDGLTADVNGLYSSMMSSESLNLYPVGEPTFWSGDYIPDEARSSNKYFFIRVRTRFYIKHNKLPFVQVKNNRFYKATESLETSDVYNYKDGLYYPCYIDRYGNEMPALVEMTLTQTDWKLLLEHYNLADTTILDGCYFDTAIGIFDNYINKYKKLKQESKGARRELAKLFLNNLYGKMASSTDSSFKVAYLRDDKAVGFYTVNAHEKEAGYIPVGSAITSYARNFTIRAAQMNYYGKDKAGFIYADTDSIHCDLPVEQLRGIRIDPKEFCCWKLESQWDIGWFVRQKTYIEHVTGENLQPIEKPFYNIKCAGMPQKCKDLFQLSMQGYTPTEEDNFTDIERKFLSKKRTIEDFTVGLAIPGKLLPKRIPGGTLLVDTIYQMR